MATKEFFMFIMGNWKKMISDTWAEINRAYADSGRTSMLHNSSATLCLSPVLLPVENEKEVERFLLASEQPVCIRISATIWMLLMFVPLHDFRRRLPQRYPEPADHADFVPADKTSLLRKHTRKKVSIVPPNYSLPSTSTSEFKELPSLHFEQEIRKLSIPQVQCKGVVFKRFKRFSS